VGVIKGSDTRTRSGRTGPSSFPSPLVGRFDSWTGSR